jgi:hypothetical protein
MTVEYEVFQRIVRQIDEDVRAACDFPSDTSVQLGPRTTAAERWPKVTILLESLARDRQQGGVRLVIQTWSFLIEVELPKRMAKEADAQALKFMYADRIMQRMTPYIDGDEVPDSPGPYAGVIQEQIVTKIDLMRDKDSDGGWKFSLSLRGFNFVCQ